MLERPQAYDFREQRTALFRRLAAQVGQAGGSPVDPGRDTRDFVDKLKLKIDGTAFDWDAFSHLAPLYEDNHRAITIMAGAQSGKSAYLLARLAREMLASWGGIFGYFFPDFHLPRLFSKQRFRPMMADNPELTKLLGSGSGTDQGKGTDAVLARSLGPTSVYFLSVAGKTSTEGAPMKGVFFDEVRRMAYGDIQRAEERVSAQKDPVILKVSTARYPESDIDAAFRQGDQRYFHSDCRCPGGCVLSLTFPNCIADLRNAQPELLRKVRAAYDAAGVPYLGVSGPNEGRWLPACYVCPRCGTPIVNPRNGWWEEHNPGAWTHSYQLPQLLSPLWPAGRVWKAYTEPEAPLDVMEFHNSKLGLPYIDETAVAVKEEHLAACVDPQLVWAANQTDAWRRKHMRGTSLGADCQAGYNVVVIKKVINGKRRTVHLEIVHGDDPWERMAVLMQRYDVSVAVIDCMPHWNEAHRFAVAFMGRVWLAVYTGEVKGAGKMISWGDRSAFPADQKGDEKFKWMVRINRTKGLQWSLKGWEGRENEVPHPMGLIQQLPRQGDRVVLTSGLRMGTFAPVPICRDVYFDHQKRVIFVKDYPSEEHRKRGEFTLTAEHVGIDPHFAHANLYCDVACSRSVRARTKGPDDDE